ncbi:MAG: PLP-dependent transferase, partial [Micrococcales bacterium]|nr:PLP-dependent transferase [Micrococcales bacterium]
PIDWGADIVIHSATKYLSGHGTAVAGAIVDAGRFDYTADPAKYPGLNEPDPGYHGLRWGVDLGADGPFGANLSYILKARSQLLRDLGAAVSPFNAWLVAQGIETLSLRMERHVANTEKVATWLDARDDVNFVHYAGLPSSPYHALKRKYAPKGAGAVLSFELPGGVAAGKTFVSGLTLHSHVANIGDVRSLVVHPASTTHAQLGEAEQALSGVTPGLIRLAVGLEHIDDIIDDLDAGFRAVAAGSR